MKGAAHAVRLAQVLATVLLAALVAACAGEPATEDATGFESGFDRVTRAGLSAFALGRYEQAEGQFRRALSLAVQRDDPRRIVDARYNLAASLAELGRHDEALAQLASARAEIAREGLAETPDLWLLAGVIHYREGMAREAGQDVAKVLTYPAPPPGVLARARFLAGLLAADAGDQEGLKAALAALPPAPVDARLSADRMELEARLMQLDGDAVGSVELLGQAARARGAAGEYRAAARVLATAARIAGQAGLNAEAARHYLRAGRSAAARGATSHAREWLEAARRTAQSVGDEAIATEAGTVLATLEE